MHRSFLTTRTQLHVPLLVPTTCSSYRYIRYHCYFTTCSCDKVDIFPTHTYIHSTVTTCTFGPTSCYRSPSASLNPGTCEASNNPEADHLLNVVESECRPCTNGFGSRYLRRFEHWAQTVRISYTAPLPPRVDGRVQISVRSCCDAQPLPAPIGLQ